MPSFCFRSSRGGVGSVALDGQLATAPACCEDAATFPTSPSLLRVLCHEYRRVQTALRNCTRDEGRSFEVGNQVLISSHRKVLLSKAMVVNVILPKNGSALDSAILTGVRRCSVWYAELK